MPTCSELFTSNERIILSKESNLMKNYRFSCTQKCKPTLDWKNSSFWDELPYPQLDSFKNNSFKADLTDRGHTEESVTVKPQLNTINKRNYLNYERYLHEKYFKLWKNTVDLRLVEKKNQEIATQQRKKLDSFINELKNLEKIKPSKIKPSSSKPTGVYKNRFKAQKSIIEMQKARLEEQSKVIQELRLGILSKDIEKSMEKAKINIRELFADCSGTIKYKIPVILGTVPKFSINSQKAPKMIQKMEQKAIERAEKRKMILERKKLIEEIRQKMAAEAVEKKRMLEEEEKKRMLEIMKEKRRKELELEKIKQAKKQLFMEKWNKAVQFYDKILLKTCFNQLHNNMKTRQYNYSLAVYHHKNSLLERHLKNWMFLVEDKYKIKYDIADAHFQHKILRNCFKIWCEDHLENIRNMQVAEDFYDFKLIINTFNHWNRYVCVQFMIEKKKMSKAENHYKRWLLFHYFYQWRSLKAIIQLEKAKEIKKERWRQKVWEVLPDYKPPEDF